MKTKIRFLAFFIALVFVTLSFASCHTDELGNDASTSESSSQSVSENSETSDNSDVSEPEAENPAPQIYADAAARTEENKNFALSFELTQTRTSGLATVSETKEAEFQIISCGEDDMQLSFEGTNTFLDKEYEISGIYSDGSAYHVYNGEKFKAAFTAEEYSGVFLPVVLFDSELYGEITLSEESSESETVILFSSPIAAEEWAAPEYAEMQEFQGETVIDSNGNIISNSCEMTFEQGIAKVEMTVKCEITYYSDELPEIEVPNPEDYRETEYLDTPVYLSNMMAVLESMKIYEYTEQSIFIGNIAGYVEEFNGTVKGFDDETEFLLNNDYKKYYYTADGDQELDVEMSIDGKEYTSVINGETETKTLNSKEVKEASESLISGMCHPFVDETYIESAFITGIDGYLTFVIMGNSLFDEYFRNYLCEYLFGDGDYLEGIAEYRPEFLEYTFTIDMDTYLPVAFNCGYTGIYTYEGYEYELGYEKSASLVIGDPETYYSITGETYSVVDTEPAEEEKAKPLFYKVTDGNGGTLYLLGTIHLGDNRTAYLPEEIYSAFEESDALALEIDVVDFMENMESYPELMELFAQGMYYTDGTTLDQHIDSELYDATWMHTSVLGIGGYGNYLSYYLDQMKPNFIASMIEEMYESHGLPIYASKGVDMRLYHLAKENSKPVYEVEDKAVQIGMNAKFSDDLNEYILASTLGYGRTYYIIDTLQMYEAWCEGDAEKLHELINGEYEDFDDSEYTEEELEFYKSLEEEYEDLMSTQRDGTMLTKAEEYLESGETVFMAVGLAHLLDEETGLVKTLAEAGYTVELVEYE